MRRGPRPGSAASPHKQAPNFYSDNSNSSVSTTSGDSSGHRSAGPGPGEPEGRRAQGSSCGEPALSPGLPGGAPRSHSAPTAEGAATLRGGASGAGGVEPGTGWLSRGLRGAVPPSRGPGSEAGDAAPASVQELPEPTFPGAERVCVPARRRAGQCVQHSGGVSCTWSLLWRVEPTTLCPPPACSEYHERVRTQGQQLRQLQAELDRLHQEVSSVRAANSERVAKLVFQRLNEDFVRKPDYALSSVGASIDLEKTSRDYEDQNGAYFWNRFSFWNYARPPMVILEPDVFPGNCWAFEGDQGQVVIRLPGRVQLSDITLQHPPPSVAHTGGANSAPRDFAVYGLQVDDETEVFLGKFTFDMEKSEIQTFRLQNDPPTAFPKVKIQILSNWGHPHFTCLYRVRAHGMRTSEEAGDSATGGPN
ncbi:sperm-associated antigen 4 protein isoform X7 [Pipistrellus kuhlii]|uniref:sperm-associated antigen 4 protein isoform X7 n=1 Tax=Pipistrellus kuhlii TaxID=59472 RepID=UPI001E272922|nr:sperm-associated antigen 4 protein isoform X7 [Pipistrellus kuhlii]